MWQIEILIGILAVNGWEITFGTLVGTFKIYNVANLCTNLCANLCAH